MKSSIHIANIGTMRAGPTMQTSCCETHSEQDKREFNTCPICLLAVHKQVCKERDRLKSALLRLIRDSDFYHPNDTYNEGMAQARAALGIKSKTDWEHKE